MVFTEALTTHLFLILRNVMPCCLFKVIFFWQLVFKTTDFFFLILSSPDHDPKEGSSEVLSSLFLGHVMLSNTMSILSYHGIQSYVLLCYPIVCLVILSNRMSCYVIQSYVLLYHVHDIITLCAIIVIIVY